MQEYPIENKKSKSDEDITGDPNAICNRSNENRILSNRSDEVIGSNADDDTDTEPVFFFFLNNVILFIWKYNVNSIESNA
jgi:hypothetical protein